MTGAGAGERQYRARPSAHAVVLDDEVLIWDAEGVRLHRLNASATRVWLELARWCSADVVAEAVALAVGVDAARVREDVDACLGGLDRAGLVERRELAYDNEKD